MPLLGRARHAGHAAYLGALTVGPVPVAIEGSTSVATKAAIVVEVLGDYVVTRRMMRHLKVTDLVIAQRAVTAHLGVTAGYDERATWRLARRLGRVVDRTLSVLPTDTRCLVQSLVLLRMLARRGIETTLVIGARTEARFEAHAWLEYRGRPVLPVRGFDQARLLQM